MNDQSTEVQIALLVQWREQVEMPKDANDH